jgi:hypothetical protein
VQTRQKELEALIERAGAELSTEPHVSMDDLMKASRGDLITALHKTSSGQSGTFNASVKSVRLGGGARLDVHRVACPLKRLTMLFGTAGCLGDYSQGAGPGRAHGGDGGAGQGNARVGVAQGELSTQTTRQTLGACLCESLHLGLCKSAESNAPSVQEEVLQHNTLY